MIDINWSLVGIHSITLAAAYVLALPIALNREAKARGAGLRTFPLVSIAACGFVLIGIDIFDGSDAEARVVSGIITGIGFIGGGAILKMIIKSAALQLPQVSGQRVQLVLLQLIADTKSLY